MCLRAEVDMRKHWLLLSGAFMAASVVLCPPKRDVVAFGDPGVTAFRRLASAKAFECENVGFLSKTLAIDTLVSCLSADVPAFIQEVDAFKASSPLELPACWAPCVSRNASPELGSTQGLDSGCAVPRCIEAPRDAARMSTSKPSSVSAEPQAAVAFVCAIREALSLELDRKLERTFMEEKIKEVGGKRQKVARVVKDWLEWRQKIDASEGAIDGIRLNLHVSQWVPVLSKLTSPQALALRESIVKTLLKFCDRPFFAFLRHFCLKRIDRVKELCGFMRKIAVPGSSQALLLQQIEEGLERLREMEDESSCRDC